VTVTITDTTTVGQDVAGFEMDFKGFQNGAGRLETGCGTF